MNNVKFSYLNHKFYVMHDRSAIIFWGVFQSSNFSFFNVVKNIRSKVLIKLLGYIDNKKKK